MSLVPLRRAGATLTLLSCTWLVACGGGASPDSKSGGAGMSTSGAAGSTSGTAGATSGGAAGDPGAATGSGGAATGSTGGSGGAATTTGTAGDGAGGASGGGGSGAGVDAGAAGAGGSSVVTGPSGMSAGCGMSPTQALNSYVQHNITVTGLAAGDVAMYGKRNYYLRLPTGYDQTMKYPTVFLGPGCGGTGKDVIPVQNASMGNAILVGLSPVGQCFQTNGMASPENQYFDDVLKEVEAATCVDEARIFVAGFSSGSWLANQLGCLRASVLRGQGNATGGLPGNMPTCEGPIAAMLAHDMMDPANAFAGGEAARDRILKINGCVGTATVTYDAGTPSPCVQYTGCPAAYPVVWCPTTGKGHSDQIPISTTGFWKFWSSLP